MPSRTVRYEMRGTSRGSVYLVDQKHPEDNQRRGELGVVVMRKTMYAGMGEPPVVDFEITDGRDYVLHSTTKRFVRYSKALLPGEALRRSELPYLYMRRDIYDGLGQPYSFAFRMHPVVPNDH